MEHLQLGDDGVYHWTTTHVIHIDNPYDDDVLQITLSRNIDDKKRTEQQQRNAKLRFSVMMSNLYDIILEGDLVSGEVYRLHNGRDGLQEILYPRTISQGVDYLANDLIHPDYREAFLEKFSLEHMKTCFANGSQQIYFEALKKTKKGNTAGTP